MSLMNPFMRRGLPIWGKAMAGMMNEMQRFDQEFTNYWRTNQDKMFVGDVTKEVVDDADKFAVSVDVSHFKPEEIEVKLDGKVLSVQGNQQEHTDNGFVQRSFARSWTLPDEVILAEVKSSLSDKGHLSIEAPKKEGPPQRTIPIDHVPDSAPVSDK